MAAAAGGTTTSGEGSPSREKVSCLLHANHFIFTWTIDDYKHRYTSKIISDTFCAGVKHRTEWKFIVSPVNYYVQEPQPFPIPDPLARLKAVGYVSVHLRMLSGDGFSGLLNFSYVDGRNCEIAGMPPISRDKFVVGHSYGHAFFLCHDAMFDPSKGILSQSGSLTVRCTLSYSMGEVTTCTQHMDQRLQLSFSMESLIGNEKFSDVEIIARGSRFPAHKVILCSRSQHFANMFEHDTLENRKNSVELDMDVETTREFLRYLYTGSTNPPSINVAESLYIAADMYLMDELKLTCTDYLLQHLSLETAFQILSLADRYDQINLKDTAMNLIINNLENVIQTAEWHEFAALHSHIMTDIIQSMLSDFKTNYISKNLTCIHCGNYVT